MHQAKALVLRCMDFRFVSSIREHLLNLGLGDQYDLVSVAGAAKNLVDPSNPADPEFIFRQIDIAHRLHQIEEVIIINHLDCGAYGKIFNSPDEERARHVADLNNAKAMIAARFPNLRVVTLLAGLAEDRTAVVERVNP